MSFLAAVLLAIVLLIGWGVNLFGVPGNWINVGAVVLYAWVGPALPDRAALSLQIVFAVVVLALLGELVEFLAGAAGVKKAGGSRRGAILALLGSIIGAIAGAIIGVPIPVIGSIIAALLFAAAGALLGAMGGELLSGRTMQDTWPIARAAFWGRLFGTFGKLMCGAVIVATVYVALVV